MATTQQKCLCILFLVVFALGDVISEPYNLYGEPGQAYSIEVNLGHPHQKLNLVIDTGSTTLAVASHPDKLTNTYFDYKNSCSIFDSGKEVSSKYSQGMWVGRRGSDYIQFPSLPNVPEVRTDLALIAESHMFFMNGSNWQGLLGLAYLPIAAGGDSILVDSWLSSLDATLGLTSSFQISLCGPENQLNATHYGRFRVLDDEHPIKNGSPMFKTPILTKRWYEVGTIAVRVISSESNTTDNPKLIRDRSEKNSEVRDPDQDMCTKLNEDKSFIDSGTTNIRLPDVLFRQVVDQLKTAAQSSNVLILDEFWYHGEAACWPEPQNWSLPWLAVDLLSAESDKQYFTIEIPPQNYMRVMTAVNSSGDSGTVSEFCYKLGVEIGGETVLGYTAMEGFEVLFNRSAGWIGFQTSECGPKTLLHGPYNTSSCLIDLCQLKKSVLKTAVSIKAAQWSLCVVSIIAFGIFVYVLAPCVKSIIVRKMAGPMQISLSQAALVEQELNT